MPSQPDGAEKDRFERLPPRLIVRIHGARCRWPADRDQYAVEPTGPRHDVVDQLRGRRRVGVIRNNGVRAVAKTAACRIERLPAAAGDRHGGPVGGEGGRRREPEAAAATGDEVTSAG